MSRPLLLLAAIAVVGVAAWSGTQSPFVFLAEEKNPVSRLDFPNEQSQFSFAIVADRTGKHRANVFSHAVEKINLMQPQFVVTVGEQLGCTLRLSVPFRITSTKVENDMPPTA